MLKVVRRLRGDQFFAAACAVSVLGLGFSLRHVSAQTPKSKTIGGTQITGVVNGHVVAPSGTIRMGARISEMSNFPILPPIYVDYRNDDIAVDGVSRNSAPINLGDGKALGSLGRVTAAGVPQSCRQDAECNDCDPCTFDDCGTHACVDGDRDGFSCDPDDNDCQGKCIGGSNVDCPEGTCDLGTSLCVGGSGDGSCQALLCVGGTNDGGICADDVDCPDVACTPIACFSDTGCCGNGGTIGDGTCNLFACVELTPPAGGGNQCINATIPDGLFVQGAECDDGLICNGNETCGGGVCVAGEPFCAPGSNTVCDESDESCLPFCTDDAECDLDGDICTTDVCDAKTCVGGVNDGAPCISTTDATHGCEEPGGNNGTCTGGGDGACIVDTPLCGPGAAQCTPGFCIDSTPGLGGTGGDPCNSDANCGQGACGCPKGRCCVSGDPCARETFEVCEGLGGAWFATDDACTVIGQSDVRNVCPAYGVGIAPEGTPNTAVGPILSTNPRGCANTLFSAGDDYIADPAPAGRAVGGFISVEIVRFIASVQVQSRLTIQFWDTNEVPPVLIEDTFFVGSPGSGGPSVRTLVFDPPLVVPDVGALALVNADRFTPLGATSFVAIEEGAAVGTGDPLKIWLNGEFVSGGVLGMCEGGTRDGLWCDLPGSLSSCPGGVCVDIPDTLAFEIVASAGDDPTGGCCTRLTGACEPKLPWVCKDEGGVFQGEGTFCRACSNDPTVSCALNSDCGACEGDAATEGDFCVDDSTCGSGLCLGEAVCTPVPPACAVQGCCSGSAMPPIPVCNSASDNAGFYCPNGDNDCDGGIAAACSDFADVDEGDCITVRGGCSTLELVCVGGDNNRAACLLDADCPLGSCGKSTPCSQATDCPTPGDTCKNNECPVGSGIGVGNFGSSCAPSVCVQPQFSHCPGGVCNAGRGPAGDTACSKCGPGDDWIDGCAAGQDFVVDHSVLAGIDLTPGGLCPPDISAQLLPCPGADGLLVVDRSDPLDDSVNFPGLRPVDAHLDVVDTEIVSMCLTDGYIVYRAGAGTGTGPQGANLQASLGTIAEALDDITTGKSTFNVFFEIEILGSGTFLYNQTALVVTSDITCVPPNTTYSALVPDECIALFDDPDPGEGTWVADASSGAQHALFDKGPKPICIGGGRHGLPCVAPSGGDNCFDAPVVQVPVPPNQSPPVALTTTITGNNAEATYDDFNEGVCNGGARNDLPCDPNAEDLALECPDGECENLCGSGIFNPNGATADPGWWEAFEITECANVRIGLCGSSLVVQPAWAFLSVGCPCANFIGNDGVDAPVGTGLGGDGSERGDPFCSLSDNLWQTFRNLPPGKYYYPILSDPDGTCAAPVANPDATGCTYQLQITTGACLEAACCVEAACAGGSDAGLPCLAGACSNDQADCNTDGDCTGGGTCLSGLVECPDGECVDGTCDAGIMIGHPCGGGTVTQCADVCQGGDCVVDVCVGGINDGGACDVATNAGVCEAGPACTQANSLRCEAAGGFWAAELNLPANTCAAGTHQGASCEDDLECPNSTCTPVAGVTACQTGELGICSFGACCDGPGECGNPTDPLALMNRQTCGNITQGSGRFIAGSRCNFPEPPCPVCTAAETPGNCQEDTAGFIWSIDVNGTNSPSGPIADDFIANIPEIGQFCFQPCFIYQDADGDVAGECSDPFGPIPPPPDQIFVRFFDDGLNDANPDTPPGFPGDPLPGSPPAGVAVDIAAKVWLETRCWTYSIVFDPPIQGFVQGQRYWVEYSGKGSRNDEGLGCELFLLGSLEGNGWSFYDSDKFGEESLGNRTWDINDAWIWFENGAFQDFAFCIEGGFTVPPPMTGACCQCDGTCTDGVAPTDCIYGLDIVDPDVFFVGATIGTYHPLQTCDQLDPPCLNVGAGGGCPGELGDPGEDCGNPICIGPVGTVCANGTTPESEGGRSLELFTTTKITTDNMCSGTDGPELYAECGTDADVGVGNDQWYEVHIPAKGAFELDLCGGRLDSVVAVYTNGTSTCPNDPIRVGGGTCPPTGDPDVCADDECATTFGTPGNSMFGSMTCLDGTNHGGDCSENGDADCPGGSCKGECFLVRVGGFGGEVGTYQMEMNLRPTSCPPSSPPVMDRVLGEDLTLTRSIAISAGNANLQQAIRVRIDSVTFPQHGYLVGSTWWVGQPRAFGEVASSPSPGIGTPNFLAAELGCDFSATAFRDWNGACVDGNCDGGLNDGFCQDGVCIGGPLEGAGCSDDVDCPGKPCVDTDDCGGGIINLYGEMLVPGASYTVSVVGKDCDLNDEASFVDASLKINSANFGDVAGNCGPNGCTTPDGGQVSIDDALGILSKFTNTPGAMRKMRADTEPSFLDFKIDVTDVLQSLRAFTGITYSFLSCQPTASSGNLCFGGPTHLSSCTTDLDCRIPLCPGQGGPSGVATR